MIKVGIVVLEQNKRKAKKKLSNVTDKETDCPLCEASNKPNATSPLLYVIVIVRN